MESEVPTPNSIKNGSNNENNNSKLSTSIQKFLEKRRSFTIEPPPEIMESCDSILKEFHDSFTNKKSAVKDDSSNNALNDSDIEIGSLENYQLFQTKTNDVRPKLKFFNLLYRITESEILEFGSRYGYTFESVEVLMDQSTNKPLGAAIAYLSTGIVTFNNVDFCLQ